MRRAACLLLLCLVTPAIFAQTCQDGWSSVQASKVIDLSGSLLASGTLSITGVDANRKIINFGAPGGGAVMMVAKKAPVSNGALVGTLCVPRSDKASVYVRYHIVIVDNSASGTHAVVLDANDIPITTDVFSLDAYPFPADAYANPPNIFSSGQVNGDLTVTGTIYAGTISGATAINAQHATTADTATNATNATNANHATSADTATSATTATNANHATAADTATNATTANALAVAPTDCGSEAINGINADGSPKSCISVSGGGSGNVQAAPQGSIYVQPNAGTAAVAGPAPTGVNAVSPLLQGKFNTDLFGTGNNGLATLLTNQCSSGNCTAMYPGSSSSTEHVNPSLNGNSVHVQDFRLGSQGDYFRNPTVGGGGGQNFAGSAYSGAKTIYANWDQPTFGTGNYPGEYQRALTFFNNFNSPGFYYGDTGDTNYTGPLWATVLGINMYQSVSTPSISELIGAMQDSYKSADTAGIYIYNQTDGGCSSGADECSVGFGLHDDQHSTWFHGTAATGATTGSQLLPVTYVSGTNSRPNVSVGGIMLDMSRPTIQNAHVTGPAVQVPGYAAWATPVDATVPVSSAWGLAQAEIPAPIDNHTPQSDAITFRVDGGTNSAGFQAGTACLDGGAKVEQVKITNVGLIADGLQTVTFEHRYLNVQTGTSLWQGGLCGTYYMSTQVYYAPFQGSLVNWVTDYPVFGARSANEIVGRFVTNSSGSLATSKPIPSFWNQYTANVQLSNLTVSGTTVTATFFAVNPTKIFDGLAQAVISGATNSAFNGTVSNIKLSNNNQTISWTQSGVSGTSATAYISYPPNYFSFFLYPGAAVTQPATSAGVPLEPNSVAWTTGDNLQNPFDPAYGGYAISAGQLINSPDSAAAINIGNISLYGEGQGISGAYSFFGAQNRNPNSMYIGGGGFLQSPQWIHLKGPGSSALVMDQLPIDGAAVIRLGCVISSQGGCGNANADINFATIDNGLGQIKYTSPTQEWYLNNIKTARTRSNILSTGVGIYVNGNFPGAPVALTAASGIRGNLQSALGTYGAFGNEGILDTSATIAAKSYYAGTIYAGAAPPTVTSVLPTHTTGSSTFSYVATSVTQNGESLPSATVTTTSGNATLSASNYNNIALLLGYGAQSTNVYRTAAPAGYSLGLICSVSNNLISGTFTVPACADTGQTATGTVPTTDTTGSIHSAVASFDTATVGGSPVCTTATGCTGGGGSGVTQIVAGTNVTISPSGGTGVVTINASASGGSGTVTSFSAGNLSPLFTSSVANASTMPAISFTLSNAPAHTFLGNNTASSAAPGYFQPAFTDLSGTADPSQLPLATPTTVGAVKPDGTSIQISGGVISATAPTFRWPCQTGIGDGVNAIPSGTYPQTFCYNGTGKTVTITGIKCYADAGSPTLSVTNGAGTALLTSAITCSNSFASGTQSATTTLAAGDYLNFSFVAGGTAKQATFVITGTYQ